MQCRTCGAPLPPGAVNCPNCGAATPYNQPVGSYDPTQRAGQVPPTSYGGSPPPPPTDPYGGSSPYGGSPYDRTTGSSPYNAGYPSQAPVPQGYPPQTPMQQGYPQYSTPGFPQVPQTPPRNNNMTVIIAAVAVVVVVAVIIGVFALSNKGSGVSSTNMTATALAQNTGTTPTSEATTAPTPTATQAQQTNALASQIISNAQTASAIDPDHYTPTKLTSTFKAGDTVYITYQIDVSNVTPKDGYFGNVMVKYYSDGSVYSKGTLDDLKEDNTDTDRKVPAYFSVKDYEATADGKVELYWCDTNACDNPQLAQVVTFTVS
jgi:hypothetical protein